MRSFNSLGIKGGDAVQSEPWHELPKRVLNIESKGQTYQFVEIEAKEPSSTLVLSFPGFEIDGAEEVEPNHIGWGQKYSICALRGYGELFLKEALLEAVEKIIQETGEGKKVILHGTSFGGGVVYDLISDVQNQDFLKRNNIVGAVLRTPVLDRKHLASPLRDRSKAQLIKATQVAGLIRTRTLIRVNDNRMAEALREKTSGKTIGIPMHIVFAEGDNVVDNEKTFTTLRSQAAKISQTIVASNPSYRHEISDHDSMFASEGYAIEKVCAENGFNRV